ncbi:MAG: right-handed parallel beta-helix repeat-containing protein, partial [Verrucomicrobia bacterium]|nr:right-handed parallel beta-helix repeat-containing protein [Verrucomicrobiota bacterium]
MATGLLGCVDSHPGTSVYHIAPDGNDDGAGSVSVPFKSFARAFEVLQDGETLLVSGGVYTEEIRLEGYTNNVTLRGKAGESAVLRGTRRLPRKWVKSEDGIWSQRLDFDIWQLFNGDRLVYLARWPDATFEDGSMWRMAQCMRSADGGYDKRKKAYFGRCGDGLIADASFTSSGKGGGFFREGDSRYKVEGKQETLAECGKDFTGAVAMLNVGHWLSYARPITRHGAGADTFEYEPEEKMLQLRYFAWYVRGLAALDRPNEWWFDHTTRTVYYMPEQGGDPNTLPLEGRVRDLVVELENCANLRFENLTCFSGAFSLKDCREITFEGCRFLFAATHKIPLGDFSLFKHSNHDDSGPKMPSVYGGAGNAFINCEFGYCNAPIYIGGNGDRVENCTFHDIEWDLLSNGASGTVILRND